MSSISSQSSRIYLIYRIHSKNSTILSSKQGSNGYAASVIIGNDHELRCANNAVLGMLQLLLCSRFYAKEDFQQADENLMGINRQTLGVAASSAPPSYYAIRTGREQC